MNAAAIIKKYQLDKTTWTQKSLHGVLHNYFPVVVMPLMPMLKNTGESFKIALFFTVDDQILWFWHDGDMERMRNSVIKKVNSDKNFLKKLVADWHIKLTRFRKIFMPLNPQKLSALSDYELVKLYSAFNAAYVDEYSIAVCYQDPFSMHADRFLIPRFQTALGPKFGDYFPLLTAPVNESFINQEESARYKLLAIILKKPALKKIFRSTLNSAELIKRLRANAPSFLRKLSQHARAWHYLHNNYAIVQNLGEEFFADELDKALKERVDPRQELRDLKQKLLKAKKTKTALLEKLRLSIELKNLLKIAEVFAYMQDERKRYVLMANYYQTMFCREFGKRLHLSLNEMRQTVYPELYAMLLKHRVNLAELKKRKTFSLTIHTQKGYQIFTGVEAKRVFEKVFNCSEKFQTSINGVVASNGIARGVVKVVKKIFDLGKVAKGDILVASMTRPEMVSAMKKAGAIITDEGGITSHAAVVSRELGIPCLIGTKIATKVLKDGDSVEVDANRGVVRRVRG